MMGRPPKHMHIFKPWQQHLQSLKKLSIKLEELRPQATHIIGSQLTPKPHAHLQTMQNKYE